MINEKDEVCDKCSKGDMGMPSSIKTKEDEIGFAALLLYASLILLDSKYKRLEKLVKHMWPVYTGSKRCTFADRLRAREVIDELGIEVD